MMMKTDVLTGFDKVLVSTAYKYRGSTIHHLPFDLSDKSLEPVYTEFEGWSEDLRKMNNINQLPETQINILAF